MSITLYVALVFVYYKGGVLVVFNSSVYLKSYTFRITEYHLRFLH
jgi:hypothetical protein